jgi:hypothetical protein
MLDENAKYLGHAELDKHVRALNLGGVQAIDAEWEVAVLNAFTKLGRVSNETLGGPGESRPDILFSLEENPELTLVGDVVTISDAGAEENTPVTAFYEELERRLRKDGLHATSLNIYIGDRHDPANQRYRAEKAVPPKSKFNEYIFNSGFRGFIRAIKEDPQRPRSHTISAPGTYIVLNYKAGTGGGGVWSAAGYSQPLWRARNPLFHALKTKARQLKRTSLRGHKVIIVCDGDCDILSPVYRPYTFQTPLESIIDEFLRQNTSVGAVIVLSSERSWLASHHFKRQRDESFVSVRSYINSSLKPIEASVIELTKRLEAAFAIPEHTAMNARTIARKELVDRSFRPLTGGTSMSENKITLSTDTVLALLAGEVTFEEYSQANGIENWVEHFGGNPFIRAAKEERRISDIKFIKEKDDQTSIEFTFSHDASRAEFLNPHAEINEPNR